MQQMDTTDLHRVMLPNSECVEHQHQRQRRTRIRRRYHYIVQMHKHLTVAPVRWDFPAIWKPDITVVKLNPAVSKTRTAQKKKPVLPTAASGRAATAAIRRLLLTRRETDLI